MKKLITIAALLGAVSLSQGQLVDFENFNNSLIYTNSVHNGPATGLMSGTPAHMNPMYTPPGSYVFMLFAAPTGRTTVDASLAGWDPEAYGVSTGTPGLMNGNTTTDPGAWLVAGYPSGYPANFLVVGWSVNIGDNWGEASAWWNDGNPTSGPSGWFGISDIAQDVVVGGNPYPVPTVFGPTVGYEVQGFTLNYYLIPEPSTFALVGSGFVALLTLRRKRFGL
ncbi:MAG: PEP-CTERM sorting domain-containing protein [Verrucomicrobiota bacterium]|jgi:hypothetical protein